jgi:hypothetical protein
MSVSVTYVKKKLYEGQSLKYWRWYFKKFTFIRGFQIRLFGVHVKVTESNATNKLIKMFKHRMPQ